MVGQEALKGLPSDDKEYLRTWVVGDRQASDVEVGRPDQRSWSVEPHCTSAKAPRLGIWISLSLCVFGQEVLTRVEFLEIRQGWGDLRPFHAGEDDGPLVERDHRQVSGVSDGQNGLALAGGSPLGLKVEPVHGAFSQNGGVQHKGSQIGAGVDDGEVELNLLEFRGLVPRDSRGLQDRFTIDGHGRNIRRHEEAKVRWRQALHNMLGSYDQPAPSPSDEGPRPDFTARNGCNCDR